MYESLNISGDSQAMQNRSVLNNAEKTTQINVYQQASVDTYHNLSQKEEIYRPCMVGIWILLQI